MMATPVERFRAILRQVIDDRRYDDRGFVAGAEMLIFGVIAFVMGSLLIINVWNVVDSTLAVSAAAREGARTYVEGNPDTARAESEARILQVMDDFNRSDRVGVPQVSNPGGFERCSVVTVTASYEVALVTIPLFGQFGTLTEVEASHSGRIDAYRSGNFGGEC